MRAIVTMMATMVALLLASAVALAQEYPPAPDGVEVECSEYVTATQSAECIGTGFEPNSTVEVTVTAAGEERDSTEVTADATGTATYTVDDECDVDALTVTMSGTNDDGNADSDSDTIDCPDLPVTGAPFGTGAAAIVLLSGIAALFVRRRLAA